MINAILQLLDETDFDTKIFLVSFVLTNNRPIKRLYL